MIEFENKLMQYMVFFTFDKTCRRRNEGSIIYGIPRARLKSHMTRQLQHVLNFTLLCIIYRIHNSLRSLSYTNYVVRPDYHKHLYTYFNCTGIYWSHILCNMPGYCGIKHFIVFRLF